MRTGLHREVRGEASRHLRILICVCVGGFVASIAAVAWSSRAASARRQEILEQRDRVQASGETCRRLDARLAAELDEIFQPAAGARAGAEPLRTLDAMRPAVAELVRENGAHAGSPDFDAGLDALRHLTQVSLEWRADLDARSTSDPEPAQATGALERRAAERAGPLLQRRLRAAHAAFASRVADVYRGSLERVTAASAEVEASVARIETWLYAILGLGLLVSAFLARRTARAIRRLVARLQLLHARQQKMIDRLATLQAAVESADTGIVVCDPDGTARWSNPAVGRLTGRTPDEITGRHIEDFLVPLPGDAVSGAPWTGRSDQRFVRKDGTERTAEASVTAVLDPAGATTHRVVFLTDVTENRTQAENLRRTLAENRMILDSITSILVVIDGDLRIRTWNHHAENILGRTAEEVAGRRFDELGLDFLSGPMRVPIESSLRERVSRRVDDLTFRKTEDETRYLAFTIAPIQSREGALNGCLLVGRDLTEMRTMQDQLAQAHKLESIGQLAAGIAHEINTPTQFVSDNTRFVQSSFRELEELLGACRAIAAESADAASRDSVETLRAIVRKTDLDFLVAEIPKALEDNLSGLGRVAKIVGAMKQFSHMGTGSKELVDLNAAIQNTCTVARNEWKYVADVVFDFQADLPLVPCLPAEMAQVFLNIVVNAAHALHGPGDSHPAVKGRIGISTRAAGGWVEIRISDTGCGIPESIRRRIYDPFFTTKGVGKGTGQGLAIARSIVVDRHGGTIGCESEVGKGTTFVVRLPLEGSVLGARAGAVR